MLNELVKEIWALLLCQGPHAVQNEDSKYVTELDDVGGADWQRRHNWQELRSPEKWCSLMLPPTGWAIGVNLCLIFLYLKRGQFLVNQSLCTCDLQIPNIESMLCWTSETILQHRSFKAYTQQRALGLHRCTASECSGEDRAGWQPGLHGSCYWATGGLQDPPGGSWW